MFKKLNPTCVCMKQPYLVFHVCCKAYTPMSFEQTHATHEWIQPLLMKMKQPYVVLKCIAMHSRPWAVVSSMVLIS